LSQYSDRYKQIKLITHLINKKQGGARNSGVKVAKGKFIGFVDADDYIDKDMYKILYEKAIEEDADIVDSDYIEVYTTKKNSNYLKSMINFNDENLILNAGRLWTKIYKTKMLLEHNIFFPENMFYEDNAISGLHLLYADKIAKVNQNLYYYVRHQNSTVSNANLHIFDKIKAGDIFYDTMKERGFLDKYNEIVLQKYFEIYFKTTYRLVMKYENNYMSILTNMLKKLQKHGVDIASKNIQENLKIKEKFEIWLLNIFPSLFQIYVNFKYKKYKDIND